MGVALRDNEGPLLNAFFAGNREELTDSGLIKAILNTGWMTAKVMVGIHWEALKLFIKGVKLKPRPKAPKRAIEFVKKQIDPAE